MADTSGRYTEENGTSKYVVLGEGGGGVSYIFGVLLKG